MSSTRGDELNALWDRVVANEIDRFDNEGDLPMLTMLARAGSVSAPRTSIWSTVKANIDGKSQTRRSTSFRWSPFSARESKVRMGWLVAGMAVLAIMLIASYALTQIDNYGSSRPPDRGNSLAAPTTAATPTKEPVVIFETVEGTMLPVQGTPDAERANAETRATAPTPESNPDIGETVAATSTNTGTRDCGGTSAIVVTASPPDYHQNLLFVRIVLAPGAEIILPGSVGPICVDSGELDLEMDGSSWPWQPDDDSSMPMGVSPVTFRNRGTEVTSLLAAVIGNNVQRFAIPDGASITLLGEGSIRSTQTRFVVTISTSTLSPGERLSVDTGSDSAAAIAVDGGEITIDGQTASATNVTRFDGRPLQLQEQLDLQEDDDGNQIVPEDYSYIASEAALTIIAGDKGAELTMLTVDSNSALLSGFEYESEFPSASPTARPAGADIPMPDCTFPAFTEAEFNAYFGTPLTTPTIEAMLAKPRYGAGDGSLADAATVSQIRDTLIQTEACGDLDHVYNVLGIFSVDFLAANLVFEDMTYEELGSGWTFPPTSATVTPIAIWDVRMQPDGRVTAKIESDGQTALYTFVRTGDHWQIDDMDPSAFIEPAPATASS